MDEQFQTKVAVLRQLGVKHNLPLVDEVLDGLTARIKVLEDQQGQVATQAAQEQTVEHNRQVTLTAINSLSFSELEAIKQVLQADELRTGEGLLVASKIADQFGITRSVIVNGLRKLESAGILTSVSLGMKGTRIKMLIPEFSQAIRAS